MHYWVVMWCDSIIHKCIYTAERWLLQMILKNFLQLYLDTTELTNSKTSATTNLWNTVKLQILTADSYWLKRILGHNEHWWMHVALKRSPANTKLHQVEPQYSSLCGSEELAKFIRSKNKLFYSISVQHGFPTLKAKTFCRNTSIIE